MKLSLNKNMTLNLKKEFIKFWKISRAIRGCLELGL